jgi:DNA-binding CsgD family transcriptional regulator
MAGDYEMASARLQHALRMNLAFDRVGTALKIDSLAWMSASRRQLQRAARLLGAARAIWSDLGTSIAAFGTKFAERSDDCYAELQAAISPTQLDSFLAEGARLDYESLLAYAVDTRNSAAVTGSNGDILTARERQVADLLADGLSNRRIAERLVLSPRTVEGYVASVLSKLALESRSQVVAWVTRERSRLTAGAPIT